MKRIGLGVEKTAGKAERTVRPGRMEPAIGFWIAKSLFIDFSYPPRRADFLSCPLFIAELFTGFCSQLLKPSNHFRIFFGNVNLFTDVVFKVVELQPGFAFAVRTGKAVFARLNALIGAVAVGKKELPFSLPDALKLFIVIIVKMVAGVGLFFSKQ